MPFDYKMGDALWCSSRLSKPCAMARFIGGRLQLGAALLLILARLSAGFTALVETCHCGGGHVLCDINDIISTTRPDPTNPSNSYFVSVLNNCVACSAGWVAVQSELLGYPTLLKNGAPLNPWEVVEVGPNPGHPVSHPPTQVNFTCIRH